MMTEKEIEEKIVARLKERILNELGKCADIDFSKTLFSTEDFSPFKYILINLKEEKEINLKAKFSLEILQDMAAYLSLTDDQKIDSIVDSYFEMVSKEFSKEEGGKCHLNQ